MGDALDDGGNFFGAAVRDEFGYVEDARFFKGRDDSVGSISDKTARVNADGAKGEFCSGLFGVDGHIYKPISASAKTTTRMKAPTRMSNAMAMIFSVVILGCLFSLSGDSCEFAGRDPNQR
jgi:hypothetical protein